MNYLYAPWRSQYVQEDTIGKTEDVGEDRCIFCTQFAEQHDEQNFILRRFTAHIVMLNKFPYNAGHLMIIPLQHKPSLEDFSAHERLELIELTTMSTAILKKVLKAEGINIGVNLGKSAGAGIPSHLHVHVLPRWQGDTSFLPLLANTKQISIDLVTTYAQLKLAFEHISFSM